MNLKCTFAKRKKPIATDDFQNGKLHDSIYMTFYIRQKYRDKEQINGCHKLQCK